MYREGQSIFYIVRHDANLYNHLITQERYGIYAWLLISLCLSLTNCDNISDGNDALMRILYL